MQPKGSKSEKLMRGSMKRILSSALSLSFPVTLRAVYRWILDPVDRDAVLAHVAIKKSEVDFKVLIEISCIYSPEELLGVRRAYQNRYKHSLEEDLASHTSGDLRKLLVALVSGYRYNGVEVNARLADSEADIVHKAIKDNCFNNDELIRILTTRSKPQLNATFNRYRRPQNFYFQGFVG
uniref:Annexin n=1 Tax=Cannabis sativa TaxID=3483 RepID=A0A803RCN3_CANSA